MSEYFDRMQFNRDLDRFLTREDPNSGYDFIENVYDLLPARLFTGDNPPSEDIKLMDKIDKLAEYCINKFYTAEKTANLIIKVLRL